MGMAAVFGFQGRGDVIDSAHVAATLKHFAGHGQPEGGRNIAPVNYSEREFRETHLYPFETAVRRAHARSIMASYNEWDGVPNHVNHKLLTDILRTEWGFTGFVMSDGGGMEVTYRDHLAAADSSQSGALSVEAGVDYELFGRAPAMVECWYLGQETGRAVADLLFGKISPSGKLTVTFPRSVGQLPCYYDRKPSRFREYVLADSSPLFPFGYGLSYTTFNYANLRITPKTIPADGATRVSVDVTNAGHVQGEEIVQLYIRDVISLPTRPVKELKDFARVALEPGKTRTVTFSLTPDKLAAIGLNMKRRVPPGTYAIMVGKNSLEVLSDTLIVE